MDKFTCIQQTLSLRFSSLPARNTLKPKVLLRFDTAKKAIKCSKIIHLNNRAQCFLQHTQLQAEVELFVCCSGDLPSPWKSKGFSRTFHVYNLHHGTSSPPPLLFPQTRQGRMIHWHWISLALVVYWGWLFLDYPLEVTLQCHYLVEQRSNWLVWWYNLLIYRNQPTKSAQSKNLSVSLEVKTWGELIISELQLLNCAVLCCVS